jgi:hypothetical protein
MPEYTRASTTLDSKPGVANRKESIYGMTAFIVIEIKITLKALPEKLRHYNTFKPFTCIFPGQWFAGAAATVKFWWN